MTKPRSPATSTHDRSIAPRAPRVRSDHLPTPPTPTMRLRLALLALITLAAATPARAQDMRRAAPLKSPEKSTGVPRTLPLKFDGPPTTGAITPLDLMTRLYKFADDSMMGRLAGTTWNDKGTDYIASEVKRPGLTPAGDDGSFPPPLGRPAFP